MRQIQELEKVFGTLNLKETSLGMVCSRFFLLLGG